MVKIGFLGLGNMGLPMAANLSRAGHHVVGYDLSAPSLDQAREAGIAVAAQPLDVVGDAEYIITMLPAGRHVLSVYDELLGHARPGTLFIDSSTIDVESARQAHAQAERAGMRAVDAPVSGGTAGAVAGTLTFMAGGTTEAFEQVRPILSAMGRKIVHCGGAGAGQAAKICNNMILGVSMIAVSEAFVLGEKLGLSHQALFDVASTSSGQCWALNTNCPVPGPVPASPANRDYQPGFALALMLKDMRLSQEAAQAAGADTALGRHAAEMFAACEKDGQGGQDFSAVIRAIRARSGGQA